MTGKEEGAEDDEMSAEKEAQEEGDSGQLREEVQRLSHYATLSRQAEQVAEAKVGESKGEQGHSLASSLLGNRGYLDYRLFGNNSTSHDILQQQELLRRRLDMNPALYPNFNPSNERDRMLLESLAATDAELLLRQQQRQQILGRQAHFHLSNEMSTQRQLAVNPLLSLQDRAPLSLRDRLITANHTAMHLGSARSIHGAMPTGLPVSDIASARYLQQQQNVANMTPSLRRFQSLGVATGLPPTMDFSDSQSLPDARELMRGQSNHGSNVASRLHMLSQSQGSVDRAVLQHQLALQGLNPAGNPADLSSSTRVQQNLEQRLQLSRSVELGLPQRLSLVGTSTQAATSEERLREITLERQQLEARLLDDQRRRQQRE